MAHPARATTASASCLVLSTLAVAAGAPARAAPARVRFDHGALAASPALWCAGAACHGSQEACIAGGERCEARPRGHGLTVHDADGTSVTWFFVDRRACLARRAVATAAGATTSACTPVRTRGLAPGPRLQAGQGFWCHTDEHDGASRSLCRRDRATCEALARTFGAGEQVTCRHHPTVFAAAWIGAEPEASVDRRGCEAALLAGGGPCVELR
ncbi:MAG: hypothetical protein KBG28_31360 [Kofleriaceae bacterium]|nr:hypothetical protein [Kofleriaceae bacterium]MBP6838487.1 hypothetical protein [Kofleriaceae bacterium]MBP9208509.1 hypothetical protein [Kofleriaceae bacterium]